MFRYSDAVAIHGGASNPAAVLNSMVRAVEEPQMKVKTGIQLRLSVKRCIYLAAKAKERRNNVHRLPTEKRTDRGVFVAVIMGVVMWVVAAAMVALVFYAGHRGLIAAFTWSDPHGTKAPGPFLETYATCFLFGLFVEFCFMTPFNACHHWRTQPSLWRAFVDSLLAHRTYFSRSTFILIRN